MVAMKCLGAWLTLVLGFLLVSQSAGAKAVLEASTKSSAKVVQVYADGSLSDGWHDSSKGCMKCTWASTSEARTGSKASFSAAVAAWGALVLASDKQTYSVDSVLDLWAKGSGLTSISLYFGYSATNTYTSDVRFTNVNESIIAMSAPDADGWYHIQIKISKLASVIPKFDRIFLVDVSGMGFRLVLDDISVVPTELAGDFAASDFTVPSILPVFGQDLTALKAAPNRYIVKLKKDAKIGTVSNICQELTGNLPNTRRFQGVCNSPLTSIGNPSVASSTIKWPLMTMSVKSDADLDAMRRSLGDSIEYFEADLTAYSSIRRLMEVTGASNAGARPAWASNPDSEPQGWKPAPVEVDTVASHVPAVTVPIPPTAANATNATVPAAATTNASKPAGNGTAVLLAPTPVSATTSGGDLVASIQPYYEDYIATIQPYEESHAAAPKVDHIQVSPAPASSNETATIAPIGDVKDTKNPTGADESVTAAEDMATTASVASWGLDRLDQTSLPLNGYYSSGDYDGRGVHIYILDTGCHTTHYDFRGRVGDGASAVGGGIDDDNGHGTHVAGTALGGIHGVARSATLHVVKVFGADGSGSYSNIIAGMNWVKDQKTRNGIQSAIISMSLVGPRANSLNDAVESMTQAGITVVSAAGNNRGADACTISPSSAPSAITVGASTDQDALASFSNIGSCVSIFAPGQSIVSAGRTDYNAEAIMSGTGMATPHVSGVAALYLQYRPGASPAEVKAALQGAAVGVFFESSSPQLLLNAISSRLRAAGPRSTSSTPTTTTPTPSTPTTTSKPTTTPAPAPAPAPSMPTLSFGSFGSFAKPSWCSTCSYCLGC